MTYVAILGSPNQTALMRIEAIDVIAADRVDASLYTGLTDPNKQKVATTATQFWDALRFLGDRVWPGYQRLEWPRTKATDATLAIDLATKSTSDWRNPINRPILGGTVASGSSGTLSVVSALAGNPQNYPDDFFNEGSIRIESGSNAFEIQTITDFAASSGTFTHGDFGSANDGASVTIVPPLHPQVQNAFVETCLSVAREDLGYSELRDMVHETVRKMMGRYLQRVFDVV